MGRSAIVIPDIRQEQAWDCGPTAVRAVLSAFRRKPVDVPCSPQDGTDPRTIEHVLRSAGLFVLAGEMSLADLAHQTRNGRPVLCPVRLSDCGHWVVVTSVGRRDVLYHDPTHGPSALPKYEFHDAWRDFDRLPAVWDRWGIAVRES